MSENNLNQYDNGSGGNGTPGGNNGGSGSGGNGGPGRDPRRQNIVMFVIAALLSLLLVSTFVKIITGDSEQEISYNEFIQTQPHLKSRSACILSS